MYSRRVLATIDDLREHQEFWRWCVKLSLCAKQLTKTGKPKQLFHCSPGETMQLWRLLESIRKNGYCPREGDEIMVRADMRPVSGTHRASVLAALNQPVPALVIE